MPATVERRRHIIAIADDNPNYSNQKSQVVRMAGYEPLQMKGKYHAVSELLDELKTARAEALVCDHKLNEGNYAMFEGVEAVAALYGTDIPALLVTDYVESDLDSIRKHRKRVPVLIRGGKFTQSAVNQGLEAWKEEVLHNRIPLHRRPRRAVVVIDDIIEGPKGRTLTVFVPRWREHDAIPLSEELIPESLRGSLKKGTVLTASINTDAELREDLFFDVFRLVPEEELQHGSA